ncbi:MAG TPA: putative lipid II flippase FtsW [Chloroflexota bacterium]
MRPSMRRAVSLTRDVDPWLLLAFLALLCFGILMVYSASMAEAYAYYGTPYFYVEREIIWAGIGLVGLIAAARIHFDRWRQLSLPFFGASLALLAIVMLPHFGHVSHGAQRWISFGSFFQLEPSELMKFALIIYLASWLSSKSDQVRDFRGAVVPFSIIVGVIALMIVKQPDLGTAIVVTVVALSIIYVAGANVSHLAGICTGAGFCGYIMMHSRSYQSSRITTFLNPWSDPTGSGYHTIQALLALRYGGLFGVGLGNSVQKYVLPAPHTDSILAVIAEELGLAGAVAVLLLFLVIAYRGMRIAAGAPTPFARLVAAGITTWFTFQALMNFAVITSSVPFTGVPLPFVSYGGTSMIISMVAMGVLLNISRHATGEGFARKNIDNRGRDGGSRVPRVIPRPVPTRAPVDTQHIRLGRASDRAEAGSTVVPRL